MEDPGERRVSGPERLRWALRVRAAVIGIFLVVALTARATGVFPSLGPALLAAVLGTVMNLIAGACVRRWRGVKAMVLWTGAGDLLLITYLVWATGATASPFVCLYSLQVVTTALVLDASTAAFAAAVGLTLLALAARLPSPSAGALGVTGAAAGVAAPTAAGGRLIALLSLGLTLLVLVFLGGDLARRLARTERKLAGAHGRLRRSLGRLRRAHHALREAYARLARTEAQLVAAERTRALGVLVAGMAHELGNPLTVIAGTLDPLAAALAACRNAVVSAGGASSASPRESPAPLAASPRESPASLDASPAPVHSAMEPLRDAIELLGHCREATDRAVELVVQLRSFVQGGPSAAPRRAPLRPGLESTLALVQHRLPSGARVRAEYEDVPDVVCVPAELNQVFLNLLLNAADALRPGGTLRVRLACHESEVRVTIRDDGVGIAPGDLPRVFEPFFTTKAEGQGSGLGLAVSQTIVARHGGRLEAEAPAEGGAVFTVVLPVYSAALNARDPSADGRPSGHEAPPRGGSAPAPPP